MKIEVTISPDGTVSGDVVDGPGGAGCLKELDKLLGDLGETRTTRKKRDFYHQESETVRKGVRQ